MSKRHELVNTKKTGGSDLDHPRAVHSNGKGILTACLSVCMLERVRASKSVRGSLAAFLSLGVGVLYFFFKLIRVPTSPGIGQCFRLSTCLSALASHVLVFHRPSFLFA